jgi:hypothetical protein
LAIFAAEVEKVAREAELKESLGYRQKLGMCKASGRKLRSRFLPQVIVIV